MSGPPVLPVSPVTGILDYTRVTLAYTQLIFSRARLVAAYDTGQNGSSLHRVINEAAIQKKGAYTQWAY